ncbi:hypothetical protein [Nocardia sp. NPDC004750]
MAGAVGTARTRGGRSPGGTSGARRENSHGPGVSAGIDLALWPAGDVFGAEQAQIAQLIIEYDPQPPYGAGHVGKSSRAVRRAATAQQAGTVVDPGDLGEFARLSAAVPQLAWRSAIRRVRERGKVFRRPAI